MEIQDTPFIVLSHHFLRTWLSAMRLCAGSGRAVVRLRLAKSFLDIFIGVEGAYERCRACQISPSPHLLPRSIFSGRLSRTNKGSKPSFSYHGVLTWVELLRNHQRCPKTKLLLLTSSVQRMLIHAGIDESIQSAQGAQLALAGNLS